MAEDSGWEQFSDFVKQELGMLGEDVTLFENLCPSYEAIQKNTEEVPFTDKGYQIPYIAHHSGGDTWYLPSASSFNATVSPDSVSMFIYPVRYAKPMVFQGALIDSLNSASGRGLALIRFNKVLKQYFDDALKRINFAVIGNGSGSRAYAAGTISSTGAGQTLTCTTTAATTPGQTKGAAQLWQNCTFQAIIAATGAVRGTFTVTTEGNGATCVINLTSGSITSGDPIVDVGGWQKSPKGLGWLISGTDRLLQGLDTTLFQELNSPEVDLDGALCTPVDFDNAKTMLQTRNNRETAENSLLDFTTYGQYSLLKQQGWNLTIQSTTETTGIAKKFADGDTMFIRDADVDDDRHYLADPKYLKMFQLRELGVMKLDGQELRMLFGDNGTGSDDYQRAIGAAFNPGITQPRSCCVIKRAQLGVTQVSSFA